MDRTKGKICIVTGGALGIGRACALRLAAEGASIAVFDILDDDGAKLVEELNAMAGNGKPARYWHVDVASEANVSTSGQRWWWFW